MVRKILSVVIPRFPDGTPIKNYLDFITDKKENSKWC